MQIVLDATNINIEKGKVNWLIKSIEYPVGTIINKADLKKQIVNAFEVYKSIGWPDVSNEKIIATCSFTEGVCE